MTTTSERRNRKKDRNQQALLDAALALFSVKGIYAPSIAEITDGADLGKGTFYQYFSSREDLIAELVRRAIDALLDYLKEEVSVATDSEQRMRKLFSAHGRYFHDHPEYLLLLHHARGWMKLPNGQHGPVRQEFLRYGRNLEQFMPTDPGGVAIFRSQRRRTALVLAGFISGVLSFQYILGGGKEALLKLPDDAVLLGALLRP